MANNVSARNGISRLQAQVLDVLGQQPEPVPPSVILSALVDESPAASQRVALSKALRRLIDRGLVDAYVTEIYRPGKGYLYAIRKS